MPDWNKVVRERLSLVDLTPAEQKEIIAAANGTREIEHVRPHPGESTLGGVGHHAGIRGWDARGRLRESLPVKLPVRCQRERIQRQDRAG